VLDQAATEGSGSGASDPLHRIDPTSIKSEVLAAGFKPDAQSAILANMADDQTKYLFDLSVRGHIDQFLFHVNKPK
jgi:predicted methyltransferase